MSRPGNFKEEGRDYLHRIMNAARRISEIIKSLLDYSRVGTRVEWVQRL